MADYPATSPLPILPVSFTATAPVRFSGRDGRPYATFQPINFKQATLVVNGTIDEIRDLEIFIRENAGRELRFSQPPLSEMNITIQSVPNTTYISGAAASLSFNISAHDRQ